MKLLIILAIVGLAAVLAQQDQISGKDLLDGIIDGNDVEDQLLASEQDFGAVRSIFSKSGCIESRNGGAYVSDKDCCATKGNGRCASGYTGGQTSTVCYKGKGWNAYRVKCQKEVLPAKFRCDSKHNFVVRNPSGYKQRVIKASSLTAATIQCAKLCTKNCHGYFYQKHKNGHQICGFFKKALSGKRVRHGHAEGAVCDIRPKFRRPPPPPKTRSPTRSPTSRPTHRPSHTPTEDPTTRPPSPSPSHTPTEPPTVHPTRRPTYFPTTHPSRPPTRHPTYEPSRHPTEVPTDHPTTRPPSPSPSHTPTEPPTHPPTYPPTEHPTYLPTVPPTRPPTRLPTAFPSYTPSHTPTEHPTTRPPSPSPSHTPTEPPTRHPTRYPTFAPTRPPTRPPPDLTRHLSHGGRCDDLIHTDPIHFQGKPACDPFAAKLNAIINAAVPNAAATWRCSEVGSRADGWSFLSFGKQVDQTNMATWWASRGQAASDVHIFTQATGIIYFDCRSGKIDRLNSFLGTSTPPAPPPPPPAARRRRQRRRRFWGQQQMLSRHEEPADQEEPGQDDISDYLE